jgi:hypothetical protein
MRRILFILLLVGVPAAVSFFSLPPRSRSLAAAEALPPAVRGAIHIHTRRSDGSGTPDQVAAAAARAGLKFIILTDHDNAASEPTKPYYRGGVLIIEGVEIGTADGGHIVALDLPRAPFPLGGEARDVLEDIARLGGFSIAAHPGSEKVDLRWREWGEPFDGLEWVNADSEWRDEGMASLLRAPFSYLFRPAETLASLLDRPEPVLAKWDELTAQRRVVGVAAADAHARVGLRSGEPDDPLLGVHVPSYEALFRSFSIAVSAIQLSGDAASDARAIVDGIRGGHVYSSIDALASPAAMTFAAASGRHRAVAGDILRDASREVELQVDSNAPEDARIVLFKNGREETSATGPQLRHVVGGERAVYRPSRPTARVAVQYDNGPARDWAVESSVRSKAVFDVVPGPGGTQLSMRFGLGGTLSESPFVAVAMPAGPALRNHDRVMFTARSDRPMRMSVQLRVPTSGDGERWSRSLYIDEAGRDVSVFFDDMRPRGVTSRPRPDLAMVHAVLFVVDTVNTPPGASGQIWIDDVRYGR